MNSKKPIYEIYRNKSNRYLETFYRECIDNSDKAIEFLKLTEKSLLNLLKLNEVISDYLDKMDDNDVTIELLKTYRCNVEKLKSEFDVVSKLYVIDNEPIFHTTSELSNVFMNWNSYSQIDNSKFYKIQWTKPKIIVGTNYFRDSSSSGTWEFDNITDTLIDEKYDTADRSDINHKIAQSIIELTDDENSLKNELQTLAKISRDIQSKKNSFEILLNSLLL